jgi:V/A-type H+-transporting ATPase subunit C
LEGTSYYESLAHAIEEYNKENSTQVFEIALDRFLLKKISMISSQFYVTIGPSLRFLISKEFEIRNLKIIAKGIHAHLQPSLMKDYVITERAL